jgi:hypothetical protein
MVIKFSDWVLTRESSAFTRLRNAAALGLMPPIPDASINSRSTATPWQQKALLGKGKKKKKRKSKKKVDTLKNSMIDKFIQAVDELEKDVEKLSSLKKSKKKD